LAQALRHLLLAVVGEVDEVTAHQPLRRRAMLGTSLVVKFGDLPEPAIADGGSERRDDQSAAKPGGELDGWFGEGRHIDGQRPLHGLRRDRHILEGVVLALVRDGTVRLP